MKNKVYIKMNGGLGNQMFQWAFLRMLQITDDADIFLDMSYFNTSYARPYQLDLFNIEPKFVEDIATKFKLGLIWKLRKLFKNKKLFGFYILKEEKFEFDPHLRNIKPKTFIEGFFQTERYFKPIEKELRSDFEFLPQMNDKNLELASKIRKTNSISLHIRRGDYIQKKHFQDVYAICSLDYYKKGVQLISEKYPDPSLFIFSDDIEWVKENLDLPYECIYVSHNTGKKSFEDMRLMSLCNHNIIANSSFSWWGAWLNKNSEKIVIAPKKWFNDKNINQSDVIPKSWIKLEN